MIPQKLRIITGFGRSEVIIIYPDSDSSMIFHYIVTSINQIDEFPIQTFKGWWFQP
jgi:hypothetical protein